MFVIERQEPVLLVPLKDEVDYIGRKLEELLKEKNALELMDLILINIQHKLAPKDLKHLINVSIDQDKVKGIFIDDFQEVAYPSIHNTEVYLGGVNEDEHQLPHFLRYVADSHKTPIIITEHVEIPPEKEFSIIECPHIYELRNPNIGLYADYIFSLNRSEYYGFTEDSLGNALNNTIEVRLIKTKYGKAGSVIDIES